VQLECADADGTVCNLNGRFNEEYAATFCAELLRAQPWLSDALQWFAYEHNHNALKSQLLLLLRLTSTKPGTAAV
jgi:hypothetical protein